MLFLIDDFEVYDEHMVDPIRVYTCMPSHDPGSIEQTAVSR